ncbi:MAG: LmbE family protein [candidate division WS6 bacterium GW2011_GWF2_33_92]|nr:MAG: LmbE family protein [candidate division WS6 bacterium GW2011_GWF2_33_92]OGC36044.1 MAG: hypothetical protein A2369_00905 [candidate division WS6 bacterium RIFOXYB1_FULL_33_15]
MDKKKLLIITAHPDDAELMFGGTIHKYTNKGHRVDVIVVTNGENWNRIGIKNSKQVREVRQRESKKAMGILKINSVSFLEMKDGLVYKKELIPVLIGEIRKLNPNIILSHSESEGHSDHKEVSISVKRVCNQSGEPAPIINPYWDCKESPITDFDGLFTHHTYNEGVISTTKYISLAKKDIEKKIESILCHESQFIDKEQIRDKIFTEAHFNGIACGVEYAEVFDSVTSNFTNSDMLTD